MAAFATVSDLRDTAAFSKRVAQSREPIQIIKGGERKMVVMSSDLFEQYEQLDRQLMFEAKIQEAEADTAADRVRPIADIQHDMRAKYGL